MYSVAFLYIEYTRILQLTIWAGLHQDCLTGVTVKPMKGILAISRLKSLPRLVTMSYNLCVFQKSLVSYEYRKVYSGAFTQSFRRTSRFRGRPR